MNQRQVWDKIAESWSNFRQKPVKEAEYYAKIWKPGKILDICCGNCRNLLPFAQQGFECYGTDFSREMIKQAEKYTKKHGIKVKLKTATMTNLPFKDDFFDYCISFASFHHLKTEEERMKALKEIQRVLRKEGFVVISVWNKLQLRFIFSKKDNYIKWKTKGEIYRRYYHLFTPWELKKIVRESGFKVLKSNFFGKNIKVLINNNC